MTSDKERTTASSIDVDHLTNFIGSGRHRRLQPQDCMDKGYLDQVNSAQNSLLQSGLLNPKGSLLKN